MPDMKLAAPKQSPEYRNKTAAQIGVFASLLFGVELGAEEVTAILLGIEAFYVVFRKLFRREEVTA